MRNTAFLLIFAVATACSTKAEIDRVSAECAIMKYGDFKSGTRYLGAVTQYELNLTDDDLLCLKESTALGLKLPHPTCSTFSRWSDGEFSMIFLSRAEGTITQDRDEDDFMPLSYDHTSGMSCSAYIDGHAQYMVFEGSAKNIFIIPVTEATIDPVRDKSGSP